MTTLVMPHGPTPSPEPVHTPSGPIRYVAVRANLLPDELVTSRRSGALKRRLLAGLGALLALLVLWYGLSAWATSSARHDLSKAQQQSTALQQQQTKYQPVVAAQQQSAEITAALGKLMVGDLSWKDMLTTLRNSARHTVQLDSITGTMTSGAAATQSTADPGLSLLNRSGQQEVGTLTIAGTAPDKNTVAAYVDALGKVKGLAAAFPASVTTTDSGVTFSVNVIITTGALGGRYSPQATGGN